METKYKWASPYDWLMDHCKDLPTNELFQIVQELAVKHDSDTLQDLYSDEMDRDGYFNEELEEGFIQFIHAADYTVDDVNGDDELKERLRKEWLEGA